VSTFIELSRLFVATELTTILPSPHLISHVYHICDDHSKHSMIMGGSFMSKGDEAIDDIHLPSLPLSGSNECIPLIMKPSAPANALEPQSA